MGGMDGKPGGGTDPTVCLIISGITGFWIRKTEP